MSATSRHPHAGFTLIELIISLTMGLVVVSAAMSFAVSTMRTVSAGQIREETYRNARFINMSMERDLQFTGVSLASSQMFGSLAVWGDTVVILSVPYDPTEALPYDIVPPTGTTNPLPSGGTCGLRCLDLDMPGGTIDLAAGDLARLQVNGERRLVLLQSIVRGTSTAQIQYTTHASLLHYTAGQTGDLRLDRYSSFVQKLRPIIYYLDGEKLMRAEQLNSDGTPAGILIADGVKAFKPHLTFEDGDEATSADPYDADVTNDFDDVSGLKVYATIAAPYAHPDINNGQVFTRNYEWQFTPRNLVYERNR